MLNKLLQPTIQAQENLNSIQGKGPEGLDSSGSPGLGDGGLEGLDPAGALDP